MIRHTRGRIKFDVHVARRRGRRRRAFRLALIGFESATPPAAPEALTRAQRVPTIVEALESAAFTTISSPQIQRNAAIEPSESEDALPSTVTAAPTTPE